ncbi:MAG: hypothetical protein AAF065_01770 [Verrucomicrobiota bacterium]
MKYALNIIITFGILLSAGCVTTDYQADEAYKSYWKGGSIKVRSEKINESIYKIEAKGAASCNDSQIKEAWLEFANSIAMGRDFQAEYTFGDYKYRTSELGFQYSARKLTGEIRLME